MKGSFGWIAEAAPTAGPGARASVSLGTGVARFGRELGAGTKPERHHDALGATYRLRFEAELEIAFVEAVPVTQRERLAVYLRALLPSFLDRCGAENIPDR